MDKLQRVREALADSDFFGSLTEPEIDRLLTRGGMASMLGTIWLIIFWGIYRQQG